MVTRYKSRPDSALGGGCVIALLESRELLERDYTPYLSPAERAKYEGLLNQRRKGDWLAGRLAAKYLFLSRLDMNQKCSTQEWKPGLIKLSADALTTYSPWMYQKVEVLPSIGMPNPHPGFIWCDQQRTESISLSHTGSLSCACLTFGTDIAIDIETAVPRVSAFYRKSFTEAERNWVSRRSGEDPIKSSWFFTLLWTLKESALKLERLKPASVWNLPGIEIEDLPDLKHVVPSRSSTLGTDFLIFMARVRERRRVMQVQVAVTGTWNVILTVMNPLSGVTN